MASDKQLFHAVCVEPAPLTACLELMCSEFCEHAVCLEVLRAQPEGGDAPSEAGRTSTGRDSTKTTAGLQLRATDGGRCSFVDAFFPAQGGIFSRFHSSLDYQALWLSPKLLAKAISTMSSGDKPTAHACVLHLAVEADHPDELLLVAQVTTKAGIVKKISHRLVLLNPLDGGADVFVDGSDFVFTCGAFTEAPGIIAEVLADMKKSEAEDVELRITPQALTFRGSSKLTGSTVEVCLSAKACAPGAAQLMLQVQDDGGHAEVFIARHLLKLSRLAKASQQVLLQLGPDAPLSAVFGLRGSATCQIFLAPSIDDRDDCLQGGSCQDE
ncbi:hypothetical protein FOA52_006352 [Chlamydomonas sp. UWO 241]|nr:hypothetical protein FOA52_006352 [Chlamydomonas sp. UWO 241]